MTSRTTSSAGARPRSSSDDYSFGWTSTAGFIAEFCAAGGQITKRVFPPLNTTDYSSYAQQMPTDVDGTFVAVGGAGLIPFLKAYEQAKGPIDAKKFMGNLFWGTPGQFEQLGPRVAGAYIGGAGHGGRPRHAGGAGLRHQHHRQVVQEVPARWRRRGAGVEHVHLRLLRQHLGPDQGPRGRQGRHLRPEQAAGGAGEGRAAGAVRRRSSSTTTARPIFTVYDQQLYMKDGKLAVKTINQHPGRRPDVRRHVQQLDAGPGPQLAGLREARPAVARQVHAGEGRRRVGTSRGRGGSHHRAGRSDPASARDRPPVRRARCRARRRPRRRARRAPRDPRAQRRGEDDAVQRDLRRHAADVGDDRVPRPGHRPRSRGRPHPPRDGPHLPEVPSVRRPQRRGQPLPRRARLARRASADAAQRRRPRDARARARAGGRRRPGGQAGQPRRGRSRTASSASSRSPWRAPPTRC